MQSNRYESPTESKNRRPPKIRTEGRKRVDCSRGPDGPTCKTEAREELCCRPYRAPRIFRACAASVPTSGDQVHRRPRSNVRGETNDAADKNRFGPASRGSQLRLRSQARPSYQCRRHRNRRRGPGRSMCSELVGSYSMRRRSRPVYSRRLAAFGTSTRPNWSNWKYWTWYAAFQRVRRELSEIRVVLAYEHCSLIDLNSSLQFEKKRPLIESSS